MKTNNSPILKDAYFGGTEINQYTKKFKSLKVNTYDEGAELSISDAEIKDDIDSPEVVRIDLIGLDEAGHEKEDYILIHKKDCLQIASFLLEMHTEYANRRNEIEWNFYCDSIKDQLPKKNSMSHGI